jgi:hypothetical protein
MEEKRSGLNQEDAQGLMARHLGGQRPRTEYRKERTMGQIITKREQPFVARFAEVPFLV